MLAELNRRITVLQDIGRHREAVALLESALAQSPDDDRLLCSLAYNYSHLKEYERALEYAQRAVAANPTNEWALRLRSSAVRSISKRRTAKDRAIEDARAAVRIAPQIKFTWYTLAESLLTAGRLSEAEEAAEELREIAPDWDSTYNLLARLALRRARFREAEEYAREALRIDPSSSYAMVWLGIAQRRRAQPYEAIDTLYQATAANPGDSFARDQFYNTVRNFCRIWTVSNLIAIACGGSFAVLGTFFLLNVGMYHYRRHALPWYEELLLGALICGCWLIPLAVYWDKAKYCRNRWQKLSPFVQGAYTAEETARLQILLKNLNKRLAWLGKRF